MEVSREEYLAKIKDFSLRGAAATMGFCLLLEIIFVGGYIFKYLIVPVVIPIITFLAFVFGLIIYLLCKNNKYSPVMPFLITTVTTLLLTVALSQVNPFIRVPFFLIYFYIIIHPSVFLGRKNGLYAILIVDLSYIIMVLLTHSRYPWVDINIELLKLVILTFIGLLLVLEFDKTIQRIQNIRRAALKVEEGDLTVNVTDDNKDEVALLAQSFNRIVRAQVGLVKMVAGIVDSLTDMSEQIASTASEIAASTSEIVQTTQRMTDGINEQYQELDKTITTGKTLSEVSFSVVSDVKKIEEFSVTVSDSASGAISQSDVVIKNIELIGERYGNLTQLLAQLEVISTTINKIVNTINAISEKINILSLNASIEAARAGEAGRGFSIVADEVKKLADSSQHSASEIARIIKEMMQSIETVTASTEEVNKAINDGSIVVKSTADALRDISGKVLELNEAIKNIKKVISGEEKQITDIIKQVESSHNVAEENTAAAQQILASIEEQSAAAEEFSATSEELVSVANKLRDTVKKFKINEEGGKTSLSE